MFLQEPFLYFLWQHQFFYKSKLRAVSGEPVEILYPGYRNHGAGPDFRDARIRIGGQLWAGDVEIHLRSSDWYAHHHETETDPAYDAVILHVVYQYDMPVFNRHGAEIPSLELRHRIPDGIYQTYLQLQSSSSPLKCAPFLPVEPLVWHKWLERLFVERLEEKTGALQNLLDQTVNDWESVFFRQLLRYFGMVHNTGAFEEIARRIPFHIFRKYTDDVERLEALLLGTAGLLNPPPHPDTYSERLWNHYRFLAAKHELTPAERPVKHGRIRPANFPSIRLAQFAMLYHKHPRIFDRVMSEPALDRVRSLFRVIPSSYWENHYLPGKEGKKSRKIPGAQFIDGLILNAVVPVRFAYYRTYGKDEQAMQAVEWANLLPPENNRIVRFYRPYGIPVQNAAGTQALIRLFKGYCNQNNCINCAIGKNILAREDHR